MKLGHNDHLVVEIGIYTRKRSDPQGAEGLCQMRSNNAKCPNDFSETTFQILKKLGLNGHFVVGIIIYTSEVSDPKGG